jgi:polysaccharide chain length determinant protein (PEP-CTERM system associated)
MSEPGRGMVAKILEVARRRWVLSLLPFLFVLTAGASLAAFLPSLWTAKARIIVDRQTIPETFVKSTVTRDPEALLLTLSQEILSRARLMKIIEEHNLYPELRRTRSLDDVVERMRRDTRIEFLGDDRERTPKTIAFTIAYTTTHPRVAMNVANELAGLYVAENVRYREKHAASTSDFLQSQLEEVRTRLQSQERKITEYKEQHMGELPEQREANLRTLDRLQQQLQSAQETLRRANERRQMLTQALAEVDQTGGVVAGGGFAGPNPTAAESAAARLSLLKQELTQMQSRYSDKYPDVISLREQVQALEAKMAAQPAADAKAAAKSAPKKDGKELRPIPQNTYVQSLMQQLDQATVDGKIATEEIGNLRTQVGVYQRRIENTPRREQELALIARDWETTRELFRSLLGKRGEAEMAADLEQRQRGEQFRIVDPASLPDRSAGPKRGRLFLIGLVVGLGVSAIIVMLVEHLDTSYRTVEEVRAYENVPILSTVPKIVTEGDRKRARRLLRLSTAGVAVGLLAVVTSSFVFAHNNHGFVAALSFEPPPAWKFQKPIQ